MLTEDKIQIIRNDLKKDKTVIYPFLELTEKDIQKLKILRIKAKRRTTIMPKVGKKAAYEIECWELSRAFGDIL